MSLFEEILSVDRDPTIQLTLMWVDYFFSGQILPRADNKKAEEF